MATAHARKFVGQFEIIGEATMHTVDWETAPQHDVPGDCVQGQKVTVMRGADGAMHVVPTDEINFHFQVVS